MLLAQPEFDMLNTIQTSEIDIPPLDCSGVLGPWGDSALIALNLSMFLSGDVSLPSEISDFASMLLVLFGSPPPPP